MGLFLLAVLVRFISAEYTLNRYLEWAFFAILIGILVSNTAGGVVAIALYYGGANGYGERDAVMTWLETLDDRKFSVLRCDWANRRNDPPVPIFIWKD